MAEAILMPRLSDTMTEGVIAAWHKKIGDTVKKGDLLAEVETDKATMELESYQDGVLLHIGTPTGGKLQVNDLMAIFGKAGEDISALIAQHTGGAASTTESSANATTIATASPAHAAITSAATVDASNLEEVVLMPRLSDTMTEGVIASWQKKVGEAVKKGEVLADIETDKATMELESYKDGVLLYQGAQAGEKILVNDLLCIIGQPGFDVEGTVAAIKSGASKSDQIVNDSANQPASQAAVSSTAAVNPAAVNTAVSASLVNEGRILASPLAKKLAGEKGIDLRYVKGSGDNGRITKSDVDGFNPSSATASSHAQATAQVTVPTTASIAAIASTKNIGESQTASFDEQPVSQMRKTIARRLSESLFTAPHFYLTMTIDMDAAVAARTKINETAKVKISFNDMVLKATAVALRQHPKVNSSWLGDKIRYNHHINIGVAVAVEDGLLVPVVRFADSKSLTQIGEEVKLFAQKAKDKKLQPADWEGSTFTISNLGMFGIDEFTAIINPPDSCILAIGGIAQVPVVKNGQVQPGNIMKVTMSCDHRSVDGATGAAFLQTLKSLLEEPLRMLL